ncbi:MAG: hypothetical protein ACP5O8_02930, partial [Candidatus Aenigmatarchaeota archaeon]
MIYYHFLTGSFVYTKNFNSLLNYSWMFILFGLLFLLLGIFGRFRKALSRKYDVVLVGEVHPGLEDYLAGIRGKKEFYEKELYNILKLIEETKPDYLFFETTEDFYRTGDEHIKAIYKKALEVGAKFIPMEEWVRIEPAVKLDEKMLTITKWLEIINKYERALVYADRNPGIIAEINEKIKEQPILKKILGLEEIKQDNLDVVLDSLNKRSKDLYNKLKGYQEITDTRYLVYEDRESRWAHLIAKYHNKNPN